MTKTCLHLINQGSAGAADQTEAGSTGWCWVEPFVEDKKVNLGSGSGKLCPKEPKEKLWGFCSASCSVAYTMPSTYHEQVS